ncbi:MAG: GGDEF domain-containing protein [Sphingomonadales bacterium]|nr:GGDEF domain-containing protein [Sphingomonadales bacterium]MBD3775202.1 GGDEF domain-containing protein [Paracoccaceae bacterium]
MADTLPGYRGQLPIAQILAAHRLPGLERDAGWHAEYHHEVALAVCENERGAFLANFLALVAMAGAAAATPAPLHMVLPLACRLISMIMARRCWDRYRNALQRKQGTAQAARRLGVVLAFGGASWAGMLLPLFARPSDSPAWLALVGGSLVGVSLVTALIAPLRRLASAFVAGFLAILVCGLGLAQEVMGLWAAAEVFALFAAVIAYARAAARQKHAACALIVDKRRLASVLDEALERARYLSTHDMLTGLWNRRAFFEESGDGGSPDAGFLLTIDLDHFKQLNDSHGHAAGDQVLVAVAAILESAVHRLPGGPHRAVRLGGEEFVLHLRRVRPEMALHMAELVRRQIAAIRLDGPRGQPLRVSASIGVAAIEAGMSLDEALRRSDVAMYRAKDRGRNQVFAAAA